MRGKLLSNYKARKIIFDCEEKESKNRLNLKNVSFVTKKGLIRWVRWKFKIKTDNIMLESG